MSTLEQAWGEPIRTAAGKRFLDLMLPNLMEAVKQAVPKEAQVKSGNSGHEIWVKATIKADKNNPEDIVMHCAMSPNENLLTIMGGEGPSGHNPFDFSVPLLRALLMTPKELGQKIQRGLGGSLIF